MVFGTNLGHRRYSHSTEGESGPEGLGSVMDRISPSEAELASNLTGVG